MRRLTLHLLHLMARRLLGFRSICGKERSSICSTCNRLCGRDCTGMQWERKDQQVLCWYSSKPGHLCSCSESCLQERKGLLRKHRRVRMQGELHHRHELGQVVGILSRSKGKGKDPSLLWKSRGDKGLHWLLMHSVLSQKFRKGLRKWFVTTCMICIQQQLRNREFELQWEIQKQRKRVKLHLGFLWTRTRKRTMEVLQQGRSMWPRGVVKVKLGEFLRK